MALDYPSEVFRYKTIRIMEYGIQITHKHRDLFQAEDGIRDQPRSRGLGDVYKRQAIATLRLKGRYLPLISAPLIRPPTLPAIDPVSYTHLTLPTTERV